MPVWPTLGIKSIGHNIDGVELLTPLRLGTITTKVTKKTMATYTLPTPVSVDHQWTERTSIGYNQWLSLAKITLTMPPAGRNCSLVANTSRCGEGISDRKTFVLVRLMWLWCTYGSLGSHHMPCNLSTSCESMSEIHLQTFSRVRFIHPPPGESSLGSSSEPIIICGGNRKLVVQVRHLVPLRRSKWRPSWMRELLVHGKKWHCKFVICQSMVCYGLSSAVWNEPVIVGSLLLQTFIDT